MILALESLYVSGLLEYGVIEVCLCYTDWLQADVEAKWHLSIIEAASEWVTGHCLTPPPSSSSSSLQD